MAEKMRNGIIKRGSVYYYILREVDPRTGKKKQRWIRGTTSRATTAALRDRARAAMHDGTYVAPQDLTVRAWLDRWIEAHSVELKPSTTQSYREKIHLYLVPTIGGERLQGLSPSRLSVLWRDLQSHGGVNGKPLSRRTVEFTRAVLRKSLQDAVVERVINVNPVVGSKMAKRDGKPKHTTWTGDQVKSFLAGVGESRWATLWELALGTGMRRGEICGLTWQDVDLDAGLVAVEHSTTQIGKERVTTTPKNHERRKVSIDAHLIASLKTWKAQQAAERLAWGTAYLNHDDHVFTWEDGRPVLPDYLTKRIGVDQAGLDLPRLTLHELRHTHLTVLLRSGVPVHIVAKRAGHKDPSVTLDVYADVIPDDDTNAVEVFSRAVWGA